MPTTSGNWPWIDQSAVQQIADSGLWTSFPLGLLVR
jgi:hypothetical protein